MAQRNFDEYFAKVILERCFPEKFPSLEVKDKPDLQCGTKIGVEVTNCMPQCVVEAFHLRRRARKQGEDTPSRILERIEQIQKVRTEGENSVWYQESDLGDMDTSPIKYFLDAVKDKVERLNSDTANYADIERYELFVNSFISLEDGQIAKVLHRLSEINAWPRKYSTIYLLIAEQKLLVFDMERERVTPKGLYNRLNDMAEEAKRLMGGKN